MTTWDMTFSVKLTVSGAYALTKEIAEQTAISLLDSAGWTPHTLENAAEAASDEMTQTEIIEIDLVSERRER